MSYILQAAQIIAGFEGFKGTPYYDGSAKWSVGYGFCFWNHKPVTSSYPVSITQDEAETYLQTLVEDLAKQIEAVVTVSLSDNQYAALCSFCYNVGFTAFKNSTLLADINKNDFTSATSQFLLWNKSGGQVVTGLTNRRSMEAKIFNTP